jgi:tryptophan synthase alpha chain
MSRIDQLFTDLRAAKRKAFMPFVTAGDPDLEFTAAVIRELAARGSSMCEVGIPYSDPIADGPVIQASYTRALAKKVKLAQILKMLRDLGGTGVSPVPASGRHWQDASATQGMPLVTMVSYAIIYRHGLEKYVADAKAAGVAGAIVPDLLVEESAELAKICQREDFSLIQLVTPTTPRERQKRIAEKTTGFIYYVSVTGITGERTQLPPDLVDSVGWLRTQTKLPICIGFGISTPAHVKLLAPVADGLIVGSAIVRRIAEAASRSREEVLRDVGEYAAALIKALDHP